MRHPPSARLRRYVLGEADATERLTVEQHLGACARCRDVVSREARLDEFLAESCPVPDQPHAARDAFDRLWAEVDRQDGTRDIGAAADRRDSTGDIGDVGAGREIADRSTHAPHAAGRNRFSWRRAAAWLVPLGLAAGLLFLLRTPDAPATDAGAGHPPLVVDAGHGAGASQDAAVASAEVAGASDTPREDDPADRLDAERLQAVRDALATRLRAASAQFPDDEAAFVAACSEDCATLRASGWPVPWLVRRLAQDGDAETARAALRLAAGSADCDATLADALRDPSRRDQVLDGLATAPARVLAPSLVAALADVGEGDPADKLAAARRTRAARLLAADGQPAARLALGRMLDAALREASTSPAVAAVLAELVSAAPCDVAAAVLLEAGTRAPTAPLAAACFAHEAAGNRTGFGAALDGLFPRLPAAQRALAVPWAAAAALDGALPALCAALAADPDDGSLLAALPVIGGELAARSLAEALLAVRGRPAAQPVQAALVSCVTRAGDDAVVLAAVAEVLALSRGDELPVLAGALPDALRGALYVAALDVVPALPAHQARREELLTAMARDGTAADGRRLMAWIDKRPPGDRLLALAWTTAYCLSGAEAAGAWEQRGHDPRLLVDAGRDRGAWPQSAPSPPARRQRSLDDSLRRASRAAPSTASASKETF